MVGPSLIFYYLIFTSITFSQQILCKKLLLVLKLCIKKKATTKREYKKIVREIVAMPLGSQEHPALKKIYIYIIV